MKEKTTKNKIKQEKATPEQKTETPEQASVQNNKITLRGVLNDNVMTMDIADIPELLKKHINVSLSKLAPLPIKYEVKAIYKVIDVRYNHVGNVIFDATFTHSSGLLEIKNLKRTVI